MKGKRWVPLQRSLWFRLPHLHFLGWRSRAAWEDLVSAFWGFFYLVQKACGREDRIVVTVLTLENSECTGLKSTILSQEPLFPYCSQEGQTLINCLLSIPGGSNFMLTLAWRFWTECASDQYLGSFWYKKIKLIKMPRLFPNFQDWEILTGECWNSLSHLPQEYLLRLI